MIFPVDSEGVPYASRAELDTRVSTELQEYLLELKTYPGKYPGSIIISESSCELDRHGVSGPSTPGLIIITADGKKTFHSNSGGAGKGMGRCPMLEPVKLRQGWAIWYPKRNPDDEYELNVRIYGTETEALGACVLFGDM